MTLLVVMCTLHGLDQLVQSSPLMLLPVFQTFPSHWSNFFARLEPSTATSVSLEISICQPEIGSLSAHS